jgi:transmembrane sensor
MNRSLDQVAAEWLARRFAGLTPEEEGEFQRWRATDPRHAAAYAELEITWQALDRIRVSAPAPGGAPDPDALAPHRIRPSRQRFVLPLAAAAALAIAAAGWAWLGPKQSGNSERRTQPHAEVIATAIGEVRKLDLPDGSVVRVNTDTLVEVMFSAAERRVRLARGEAHFTVAKNPLRPFWVEAGGVAVRAVGTAFNVRLHAEAVEVLVTEGRVRVANAARNDDLIAPAPAAPAAAALAPPVLAAGERVLVPVAASAAARPVPVAVVAVPPAEIDRMLAWRDRRIEVVAAPLAEIVAEFNRHNRAKLEIADPALAARRFGGSFRADDPENFVRLLETRFGLRAERRGDTMVLCAGR